MDEADVVSGGALADASRREGDALAAQPLDGRREIVDPESDVIERRLVHPGPALGIDRLHEVHLDGEGPASGEGDVLVHVLRLAAKAAARREAEQVDPQPAQTLLRGGPDRDLLDPEDLEGALAHGTSGLRR